MKINGAGLGFAVVLTQLWKKKLLIGLVFLIFYVFSLFVAETPTGLNPTELPHFNPI